MPIIRVGLQQRYGIMSNDVIGVTRNYFTFYLLIMVEYIHFTLCSVFFNTDSITITLICLRLIKRLSDQSEETNFSDNQSTATVPEVSASTKVGQMKNSPSLNVSKGSSTVSLSSIFIIVFFSTAVY